MVQKADVIGEVLDRFGRPVLFEILGGCKRHGGRRVQMTEHEPGIVDRQMVDDGDVHFMLVEFLRPDFAQKGKNRPGVIRRVGAEMIRKEVPGELLGRRKADAEGFVLLFVFRAQSPKTVDEGLDPAHEFETLRRRPHGSARLVEALESERPLEVGEKTRNARDFHVENERGARNAPRFARHDERFPGGEVFKRSHRAAK